MLFRSTKAAPWTLVDFNDQRRGRLTLLRNLLDRLPDTTVPPELFDLPPLGHGPSVELYAQLKPIADFKPPGKDHASKPKPPAKP